MKIYLFFLGFLFLQCQSQNGRKSAVHTQNITFEDRTHYSFSVTRDFLIIDSQEKMDGIFTLIHQKSTGNRLAPIPAVIPGETYVIVKPELKDSNDVHIEAISLNGNTLVLKIKPFDNPDFDPRSRANPSILLKLNGDIRFENIKWTN
ncbi:MULTISPECIES: hypothetical protein [Chryseobacterium]|uniref:Uncharacterized protein n=1 Tax=Chryseobacterium camelliae TaxID=1265445 RepID=A0ABU0TKD0_9FLAO|nr:MULTISPECIES: hypothetical protein [Chryseobacterium]MDT3408643.1 hypothetical protein [Pseudacidovorax intermedius]MDQ1097502.1 hypothetical protein [Chryseobacterium camelliae]MDQ1101431.1 hypothetical protein [Chryseobacterium sp. SORGH_AS_1048]MDR6084875.1 hypothetical protein [Chryseobacterium sp. SORGH_AS_0909]MDR6129226.1 hypothetical protein [Chryseobacterium sp. SORGH_AS_1175]